MAYIRRGEKEGEGGGQRIVQKLVMTNAAILYSEII